jgi:hypothetical protein
LKTFFFIILLLTKASFAAAQSKKSNYVLSLGLEYRQLPVDIEDLPGGGNSSGNDVFYGLDFWRSLSIQSRAGINLRNNWQASIISYIRYNHLHWLELPEDGIAELQDLKEKRNLKYDLFFAFEKRKLLKKNKEKYLFVSTGIGLSNLNTRYNVYFKDTLASGAIYEEWFKGTFLRFTPRVGLGFQFQNLIVSINGIVIEGPDLMNLTSLWLGINIAYEIRLKAK